MRPQLVEAAKACQSTTFTDAEHQVDFIRRLAFSVAAEFGRLVTLEVRARCGGDLRAGPRTAGGVARHVARYISHLNRAVQRSIQLSDRLSPRRYTLRKSSQQSQVATPAR